MKKKVLPEIRSESNVFVDFKGGGEPLGKNRMYSGKKTTANLSL